MNSKVLPFKALFLFVIIGFSILSACSSKRSGDPRILVFSKTSGYHHASIAAGNVALMKLGAENGFVVDTTSNATFIHEDSLAKYAAVVFLNTTGDVLDQYQEADFERYIQAGGGFVGIHAATDTEYDWEWYGKMVGGYFESHPQVQEATIQVVDNSHASTKHLQAQWKKTDEWYNFKNLNTDVKVLLKLDERSYEGGKNGDNHPIAWYHEYDGGRAFYTGLGHTEESYQDETFLKHLLGGIQYAIDDNKELNYSKASSERVPAEERFVKTVLAQGVFAEPTEMTILPNLDVLVAQRRGELMLYSQETKTVTQVGYLNVYHKATVQGVNAEEGLMGIVADPDFKNNNYVYLYYSPIDTSVNRLSRFVFRNNRLDMQSEKVVLQFYSQRNICCHTGGSLAFGKDRMLYLSTGDNSTPFNEKGQRYVTNGFAPLDDRPGHEQYDARRTAGNTNDLRGKILRIKMKEDGTYEIPDGNLFPKNEQKAKPEIYVMGNRNPYRISVDQKNGYLYWGEVGPDAANDSLGVRGPRGYDEFNQARKAGFFGWPLFVGNNYSYHRYDYAAGKAGATFDPAKPVNDSRNNTGLRELPPAQPAFIWYPYAESPDFPQVGSGGRTAMAGPVYYTDMFPKATAYPEYYNGKVFFYEWMRNWIKVLTLKPNGDLQKMESFMANTTFNSQMDMEVGPDGKIYIVEYGKGWFMANPEAALVRIDYIAGNLPPKIISFEVDRTSGVNPLQITAKVKAVDPEKDKIVYRWRVGNFQKETREPYLQHAIREPGAHVVSVEVVDSNGASRKSEEITVNSGNAQPVVSIELKGNRTFYFPGQQVQYQVKVVDEGDKVDMNNLYVSTDYIKGTDLAGASMGHQVVSEEIMGRNLMAASDCKSCHKVDEKSIGPSFTEVSLKYKTDREAPNYLTEKIIKGGSGVWGANAMPAHPTMDPSEARQIVRWVMSLAEAGTRKPSLPAAGEVAAEANREPGQASVLKLEATYTDNGGPRAPLPLTGANAIYLRNSSMDVSEFSTINSFARKDSLGSQYLVFPGGDGWLKVNQVDLTGIGSIELTGFSNGQAGRYQVEVRTGRVDGTKIGDGQISFGAEKGKVTGTVSLQRGTGAEFQDVFIIFKPVNGGAANRKPMLKTVRFVKQ
ncbi:ThuA domain-containing protein [Pontibacter sp. SGAir0037]|uniref:ThuA domain-containing protein n=1 Tax=Pontibacter sp. SGAir0037 TaxID=2571030 RepID=UPI0010CD2AAE|nr:ThuA domain-containing protein [Pontibacter sp. SGAir0037]QCR23147.1 Crp/Fnr family transcriptional regulator [Pontibacter sp. SGAir0037]